MSISRCLVVLFCAAECFAADIASVPFSDAGKFWRDNGQIRTAAARGALDSGLPALAGHIASDLRKNPDGGSAEEIALIEVDAYIAQGAYEKAAKILPEILAKNPSAENKIRAALVYVGQGDTAKAERELSTVSAADVPENFMPWYRLALGYVAYRKTDVQKAVEEFSAAKSGAQKNIVADAEIALNLAKLAGNPSRERLAEIADKLSENVRIYMGTPAGFQFAKQYAAVLFRLGKFDEAAEVIDQQLQIELTEAVDRDELRLVGALMTRSSARQFAVLRDVLLKTESAEVAEYAISLIGRNPEIKPEQFDSLIDEVLRDGSPKIRDKILLEKAKTAVRRGDPKAASEFAKRLTVDFPGSGYLADALRILAWGAYSAADGKLPEYRLAATYLMRLSELEKNPERARLIKISAADCYKLSSDLQTAANIYRPLVAQFPERAGTILFKAVDTMLDARDEKGACEAIDAAEAFEGVSGDEIWNAEWLVARNFRETARADEELNRIEKLLSSPKGKSGSLHAKLLWLKAVLLREKGDFARAEEVCTQVGRLENLPEQVAASALLVKAACLESLGRAGGSDGAIAVYEKLRRDFPKSDAAQISYLNQARSEAADGRPADARKLCLELAEKYPDGKYAYSALFDAALYARKVGLESSYKSALSLLDKLCADYPDNPRNFYARLEQADILKLLNSFADARALYNDIINKYTSHPEIYLAWIGLGDAALAQNSGARDAAAIFERLYSLPLLPEAARAEAAYKWSFALEREGKKNEADEVRWLTASEMLKGGKIQSGAKYWIGRSLYNLAKSMESDGRMRDARAVYETIVKNALPPLNLAERKLGQKKD